MIKFLIAIVSCATICAQRTPVKVNGSIVNNPNFTNSGSIRWETSGSIVSGVVDISALYGIGSVYTNVIVTNMTASSNYDAFTVPAGLRALLVMGAYSTNTASASVIANLKVAGSYYMVTGTTTIHTTNANALQATAFIFEPGDVISFLSDTTGVSVLSAIQLFSTNAPIRTARLTPIVNGDNVLYTAPTNKIAVRWGPPGISGFIGVLSTFVRQTSGGALNYIVKLDNTVLFSKGLASAAAITTLPTALSSFSCVPPGQSIIINTTNNSPNQFAFIHVYEASE